MIKTFSNKHFSSTLPNTICLLFKNNYMFWAKQTIIKPSIQYLKNTSTDVIHMDSPYIIITVWDPRILQYW